MEKTGYKDAIRGVATTGVPIDTNGNIVGTETSPAGTKTLTFNMVNANNNLAENQTFANIFIDFIGSVNQTGMQKLRVTWGV